MNYCERMVGADAKLQIESFIFKKSYDSSKKKKYSEFQQHQERLGPGENLLVEHTE